MPTPQRAQRLSLDFIVFLLLGPGLGLEASNDYSLNLHPGRARISWKKPLKLWRISSCQVGLPPELPPKNGGPASPRGEDLLVNRDACLFQQAAIFHALVAERVVLGRQQQCRRKARKPRTVSRRRIGMADAAQETPVAIPALSPALAHATLLRLSKGLRPHERIKQRRDQYLPVKRARHLVTRFQGNAGGKISASFFTGDKQQGLLIAYLRAPGVEAGGK